MTILFTTPWSACTQLVCTITAGNDYRGWPHVSGNICQLCQHYWDSQTRQFHQLPRLPPKRDLSFRLISRELHTSETRRCKEASRRSPINHIMTHCRQYHGAKSLHNTRLHWPSAAAMTKHCCACLTNKNREQVEPTKKTNKCGTLLCQARAACKVNNTANKHTHWAQPEWTTKKSPLHSTHAQLNLTKLASLFWVASILCV